MGNSLTAMIDDALSVLFPIQVPRESGVSDRPRPKSPLLARGRRLRRRKSPLGKALRPVHRRESPLCKALRLFSQKIVPPCQGTSSTSGLHGPVTGTPRYEG